MNDPVVGKKLVWQFNPLGTGRAQTVLLAKSEAEAREEIAALRAVRDAREVDEPVFDFDTKRWCWRQVRVLMTNRGEE